MFFSATRLSCLFLALGCLVLGCSPSSKIDNVVTKIEGDAFSVGIRTSPRGTSVSYNGTDLGTTPLDRGQYLELSLESMGLDPTTMTGSSSILLESDGYYPQLVRFILHPLYLEVESHGVSKHEIFGNPTKSVRVDFELIAIGRKTFIVTKKDAPVSSFNIDIDSTPQNASVFLNGTSLGTTPLSITKAPMDVDLDSWSDGLQIKLELDGYHTGQAQLILHPSDLKVRSEVFPQSENVEETSYSAYPRIDGDEVIEDARKFRLTFELTPFDYDPTKDMDISLLIPFNTRSPR